MQDGVRPIGIAFDLDNTLVETRIDFSGLREALLEAAAREDPGRAEAWRSRAVPEILNAAEASGTAAGSGLWTIVERFEAEGLRRARIDPDVPALLAALKRRGHPLAVWTNNAETTCRALLLRFGLDSYFDAVIGRETAGRLKPHPDGMLRLKALLPGAAGWVMVGDSWTNGAAARAAGAGFCALVPDGAGEEASRLTGDWTVRRLGEVADLDLGPMEERIRRARRTETTEEDLHGIPL